MFLFTYINKRVWLLVLRHQNILKFLTWPYSFAKIFQIFML